MMAASSGRVVGFDNVSMGGEGENCLELPCGWSFVPASVYHVYPMIKMENMTTLKKRPSHIFTRQHQHQHQHQQAYQSDLIYLPWSV